MKETFLFVSPAEILSKFWNGYLKAGLGNLKEKKKKVGKGNVGNGRHLRLFFFWSKVTSWYQKQSYLAKSGKLGKNIV